MKLPSTESSLKLVYAVDGLLKCAELQAENVSETTRQRIEEVLETAAQVQRECNFPDRAAIIDYFAKRFAEEDRDLLVKRVVSMISTFPTEALHLSFEETGGNDEETGENNNGTDSGDGPEEPKR